MIDWSLLGKICGGFLPLFVLLVLLLQLFTSNNNKENNGNTMTKRLYRLKSDRKLAGVCSGIAEYFDIDPAIVRLAWLIAVFCAGGGLIAYIIAMIVIPEKPEMEIKP